MLILQVYDLVFEYHNYSYIGIVDTNHIDRDKELSNSVLVLN